MAKRKLIELKNFRTVQHPVSMKWFGVLELSNGKNCSTSIHISEHGAMAELIKIAFYYRR